LGTQSKSRFHVEEDDPLSAVAELRRTWTMSREAWQIRIETQMRLSCTRDVFLLQGSLRAWEGANEVCRREWDRTIPRDFLWKCKSQTMTYENVRAKQWPAGLLAAMRIGMRASRGERPRGNRAAEQRDELAPSHGFSRMPSITGATAIAGDRATSESTATTRKTYFIWVDSAGKSSVLLLAGFGAPTRKRRSASDSAPPMTITTAPNQLPVEDSSIPHRPDRLPSALRIHAQRRSRRVRD
jgi:hypothetical protein